MISDYFIELEKTISRINYEDIERIVVILSSLRERRGRLFIIGSGGGAGHASHAVCDFRKLCDIEAYAPYDNISELTARTNDEGYRHTISEWLKTSRLSKNDCLLVFSVGGGRGDVSENITFALFLAQEEKATIIGIVGPNGGMTTELADAIIRISPDKYTTPIVEGLQAVIWHAIVSHPLLKTHPTVWQ